MRSRSRTATFGIGADASDYAYAIGRNGGNNAPWRSFDLTLLVQNNSGSTIDSWTVNLDTWYADTDSNNADITLSYSTDNVNFTPIDSYTTSNNGGGYTERDMTGTISAAVANGDYLYLQFSNYRMGGGGSGASVVIDNWTVAAVSGGPAHIVPVGVAVGIAGADVELTFDSVNGQSYQLLVSTDDMATWNPVVDAGASGTGDGNPMTLTDAGAAPASGDKVFDKVDVN